MEIAERRWSFYLSLRCLRLRDVLLSSPLGSLATQASDATSLNFAGDVFFRHKLGCMPKLFAGYKHGWHSDSAAMDVYSNSTEDAVLIAWIPLHGMTTDDGHVMMDFIPGSHRLLPHQRNLHSRVQEIVEVHKAESKTLVSAALGDVVLFYASTVHRPSQTEACSSRSAISYRFATQDARFKAGGLASLLIHLRHGSELGGVLFPKLHPAPAPSDWPRDGLRLREIFSWYAVRKMVPLLFWKGPDDFLNETAPSDSPWEAWEVATVGS